MGYLQTVFRLRARKFDAPRQVQGATWEAPVPRLQSLGRVITAGEAETVSDMSANRGLLTPTTLCLVQTFLGMTAFDWRFPVHQGLWALAAPLTLLLHWTSYESGI